MFAVEVIPEVFAQIQALHPRRFRQIALRIFALQMNPRPPDSVLIDLDTSSVRIGPYSITYKINDSEQRVRVFLLEETEEA